MTESEVTGFAPAWITRFIALSCAELADVAAAVLRDIDLIAVVERLHRRQRDARLSPEPGQDDLLATVALIAATKFWSSHAFMDDRSIGVCFGNTAWSCGHMIPLKLCVSTC